MNRAAEGGIDPRRVACCCALLAAVFFAAAGCGYRLLGTQLRLPKNVRSVTVGNLENRSREFGLDRALAFAIEREFYRHGYLEIEESPDRGDAILEGTIRSFETRPVSFDAKEEAVQYEIELSLDLRLQRRSDGAVLWEVKGLRELEEYTVAVRIVVASSSEFQRDTLNLSDLSQLTDIQLAQTEKRIAITRLVDTLARDVHERILDDF
jgi:hypothetical protein